MTREISYYDRLKEVVDLDNKKGLSINVLKESGAFKKDSGKPMVGLVLGDFAEALLEVSKVGTMGAMKYSRHGWRDNETPIDEKIERIKDSEGRHRLYRESGEEKDPESGLYHLSHQAWNILALLQLYVMKNGRSDGE